MCKDFCLKWGTPKHVCNGSSSDSVDKIMEKIKHDQLQNPDQGQFLSTSGYSIYTHVSGWAKQNKGNELIFKSNKFDKVEVGKFHF